MGKGIRNQGQKIRLTLVESDISSRILKTFFLIYKVFWQNVHSTVCVNKPLLPQAHYNVFTKPNRLLHGSSVNSWLETVLKYVAEICKKIKSVNQHTSQSLLFEKKIVSYFRATVASESSTCFFTCLTNERKFLFECAIVTVDNGDFFGGRARGAALLPTKIFTSIGSALHSGTCSFIAGLHSFNYRQT